MEVPPFYVYEDPRINMLWLERCDGFERLEGARRAAPPGSHRRASCCQHVQPSLSPRSLIAQTDHIPTPLLCPPVSPPADAGMQSLHARFSMPEVAMARLLLRHPARVADPRDAKLFFAPILEYTSTILGARLSHQGAASSPQREVPSSRLPVHNFPADALVQCNGTTHRGRMAAAARALEASEHYQRNQGRDHFWSSAGFSIGKSSWVALGGYRTAPSSRQYLAWGCFSQVSTTSPCHYSRRRARRLDSPAIRAPWCTAHRQAAAARTRGQPAGQAARSLLRRALPWRLLGS